MTTTDTRTRCISLSSYPDLMADFAAAADAYSANELMAGAYYAIRDAAFNEAFQRTARLIRLLCTGINA